LLLAALGLPGVASAVTFENLYTVSVTPDLALPIGQREPEAVRRGMEQLLTRITGLREASQIPDLSDMVRNAARYRDSYETVSSDEVRISFVRSAVNDALTSRNMPIWGDERPSTLFWIAVDLGGGQRAELGARPGPDAAPADMGSGIASNLLSPAAEDVFDEVTDDLLRAADERGLPVVLPKLDSVDRRYVRFADVWGGFDRLVERAAERYDVDAILIGRVSIDDDGPRVRWILRQGQESRALADDDPRAGIDWLADRFAAEYTIVGSARFAEVQIQDIWNLPDYGRVLAYLESLSIVDRVDVEEWQTNGELRLALIVRGDESALRRLLTLGGVLRSPLDAAATTAGNELFPSRGGDGVATEAAGLVFRPSWIAPDAATQDP
jgi:hypothetical protein